MDNKLDKIDAKIDKIQEKISAINVTLAAQHESLKVHIKRTDLLEKQVSGQLYKIFGLVAVMVAIIEGIIKIKNG